MVTKLGEQRSTPYNSSVAAFNSCMLYSAGSRYCSYAGGRLRQYRACTGISSEWSYVTASPSHHDSAIPISSPLLFMLFGHPYIPLFKIQRIFDLLGIIRAIVSST